jgi:hypothetical protein
LICSYKYILICKSYPVSMLSFYVFCFSYIPSVLKMLIFLALLQRRSSAAVLDCHQKWFLNHCRCAAADNPGSTVKITANNRYQQWFFTLELPLILIQKLEFQIPSYFKIIYIIIHIQIHTQFSHIQAHIVIIHIKSHTQFSYNSHRSTYI